MGNADQTDWNGTLAISFTNRNKKFSNIFFFPSDNNKSEL